MTEPQHEAPRTFPRLYDPERAEQFPLSIAEVETLPAGNGAPPIGIRIAAGGADADRRQFLVLLVGSTQDVPLTLYEDRDEAVEFAREVQANPDAHAEWFFALTKRDTLFKCDWLAVSIVEFEGPVVTASTVLFELQ
ncbi:MAG TPA: hypothetical protein VGE74_32265 [Gemmata sp.]